MPHPLDRVQRRVVVEQRRVDEAALAMVRHDDQRSMAATEHASVLAGWAERAARGVSGVVVLVPGDDDLRLALPPGGGLFDRYDGLLEPLIAELDGAMVQTRIREPAGRQPDERRGARRDAMHVVAMVGGNDREVRDRAMPEVSTEAARVRYALVKAELAG